MPAPISSLASIDAVILAGGLGTRLQSVVDDRPKPLALIQGRAFLDILVDDLVRQGLRRIVLCIGHRRESIISHFTARKDAEFLFSEEATPLGTGGAVQYAVPIIRSDPFFLLNGDSFCRVDYSIFFGFHDARSAAVSMVVAKARGRTDAGNVTLAADGKVVAFREKSADGAGQAFVNAGIYLMPRSLPASWRMRCPFSLECDVFPELVSGGRCYGYVVDEEIIDIGTPERYADAQTKF